MHTNSVFKPKRKKEYAIYDDMLTISTTVAYPKIDKEKSIILKVVFADIKP